VGGCCGNLQFTAHGHIFVCVHITEDMDMAMEGDYSVDDYNDGEVDGPDPPSDMRHNQFNTLSGYETADDRNSWETFQLLLAQEHSYSVAGLDNDGNDVVNLVVSVEDTGVGIPLQVQERVFTPFMQADSSTSRTYGGTGIGLSISKCLVELMSGEMAFVSRPEIGSTFTFTAEFHRVHDRVPESVLRNTNSVLQTPPLPTCFRGMQALVVDGRPVRSEVTRHHLRRLGIQVQVADSVSSAAAILAAMTDAGPRGFCSSTVGGGIDMILVDKDAWGQGTGINFPRRLCQSASDYLNSRQRYKYLPSSGLSLGFMAARFPKMMLVATSMTANEHNLARENGFTDTAVIKPLRASMLAACLQQALGVENRREQGWELREGSRSLHKLLSGKRVLVVDDNLVNRRVAEGALLKYGAQVECANSGRDAILKLKPHHNFDACFMDVQMPEMDGFEATRFIRQAEKEASEWMSGGILTKCRPVRIPILAMTADVIQATQARCLQCGMDGYVAKPFDEQQLYNAVAPFFETGYA
jgi:histidine kinase 2/3/4 (cytokinin receptor)